ncbi:MAG: metallophosphoesterase [Bacteroidetes bacterium]|nr:MAG: metallophosphoesterase [Bacteroidota bacterium]
MKTHYYTVLFAASVLLTACYSTRPYYASEHSGWEALEYPTSKDPIHTIYLLGDVGEDPSKSSSVLGLLQNLLKETNNEKSVVFLGDNIYSEGLPDSTDHERPNSELRINAQLDAVKESGARIYFVPGNHDWAKGDEEGLEQVGREERYVEAYLGQGNSYLPDNGCPGPQEVKVDENICIIALDAQWWLYGDDKPTGASSGCIENETGFKEKFTGILDANQDKMILIISHHPLYSNGNHGGRYPFVEHLFPMTALHKALLIPFPIIGSIYPAYRHFIGNIQDLTNSTYKEYISLIEGILKGRKNIIYAAGHEHNLQYKELNGQHHLVSGSGSKTTYLARNKKIDFGASQKGLMKLNFYGNKEVWLETILPGKDKSPVLIFKTKLR